ncbi:MAG: SAM-dependent chlorinase/fluorinase [Trueperaceae bacterium]|nr:SAM-dependent chlorinase/fluorinase [Trueperaceae bacterium]
MSAAPVFLLTDFGTRDVYAGVLRAVVAREAPAAAVHDLTHEVPPQDLHAARIALASATPSLPADAVTCAVVDPGVGSDRRAVVVRARRPDGATLWGVGPDNGLFSPWLGASRPPYGGAVRADAAWVLDPARVGAPGPGTTFDGRDLFAPAAGRLARGASPEGFADPFDPGELVRLPAPGPVATRDALEGRVAWIDRFGDVVTNVPIDELPAGRFAVELAGRRVEGPTQAFADVPPGQPLAYLGSYGALEIAVAGGSVASAWGVALDQPLRVVPLDGADDAANAGAPNVPPS